MGVASGDDDRVDDDPDGVGDGVRDDRPAPDDAGASVPAYAAADDGAAISIGSVMLDASLREPLDEPLARDVRRLRIGASVDVEATGPADGPLAARGVRGSSCGAVADDVAGSSAASLADAVESRTVVREPSARGGCEAMRAKTRANDVQCPSARFNRAVI